MLKTLWGLTPPYPFSSPFPCTDRFLLYFILFHISFYSICFLTQVLQTLFLPRFASLFFLSLISLQVSLFGAQL